jgi:hypothetical protein
MTLKKLSNRGLLLIEFSKDVIPVTNLSYLKRLTQVNVKKSDRYSYSTQFTVVNMTARSLNI